MAAIRVMSWGLYLPRKKEHGRRAARRLELPPEVVEQKLGFVCKRVPSRSDGCAAMAAAACRTALRRAKVRASDVDLVLYCGSEHKEHIVWSAASHIARLIGSRRALCFEVYALCAGLPIALHVARNMMEADRGLKRVLVATASREGDLIDYKNQRTRWMANFGAGGGALLLGRTGGRAEILGFGAKTDSRLSTSVVQPAGGSAMPASENTVRRNLHRLDVRDMEGMRKILEKVSMPGYKSVVRSALRASGLSMGDIDLLCVTLMKPSFHRALVEALGLEPRQAPHLDGVGHMQSVDQVAALEVASGRGLLKKGSVVVLAAAGTGYTWSALVLRMLKR
jgi:3-oxoacyl-[acyl-carrier-protein] synthase-3